MKKVQVLSIVAIIVTIIVFVISKTDLYKSKYNYVMVEKPIEIIDNTEQIIRTLEEIMLLINMSHDETFSDMEMMQLLANQEVIGGKIVNLQAILVNGLESKNETQHALEERLSDLPKSLFGMKEIFSIIFCLAALFIVLSNKYDEGTKKWAFSVLTLIAGVWIGGTIN